jgi:hypothetical protein
MRRVTMAFLVWSSGAAVLAGDPPAAAPVKEPVLRGELLRRSKADQDARNAWIGWINKHGVNGVVDESALSKEKKAEYEKVVARVKDVDEDNTKWLKRVVDKDGWPTKAAVGKDGTDAAFLLVQHADAEPKFQRQCLDRIAPLPKDEVSQSSRAYLTDRVLLAEGKKQVYGTQFTTIDGKLKPRPLEDEANVDKRRAEVGLPPLAEYVKRLEELYGGKPSK